MDFPCCDVYIGISILGQSNINPNDEILKTVSEVFFGKQKNFNKS